MGKDLYTLLDKCIDRMNEGESLEDCLLSYPEHARELEPLLQALCDARDACGSIPRPAAKATARQRVDAAAASPNMSVQKRQRRPMALFGWSKALASVCALLLLVLIGLGLHWTLAPATAPVLAQPNFRFWLSDEVNAITDFQNLTVTVSGIGLQKGGNSSQWVDYEINPPITEDLTRLTGNNATEIWSGYVSPGEYTKVFIYVDSVEGILLEGGAVADVKLPGNKMQISKPFIASVEDGNLTVDFVFDITVVKAGNSGQYNVKPQISESGPDQDFDDVGTEDGGGTGEAEEVKFKGTIESIDFTDRNPRWKKLGDVRQPLATTKAVLLPDGNVLIGQGVNRTGACTVGGRPCTFAEREGHQFQMLNPVTGMVKGLASTTVSRGLHGTATLLPDASVFFAGENREALVRPDDPSFPMMSSWAGLLRQGDPDQGVPVGQLFSPSYLFRADGSRAGRPVITDAPEETSYRGQFDIEVAGRPDQIAAVVILRSDHNTHSLTAGDRYVKLGFHRKGSEDKGELRVRAPRLPAQAIPGIYMLFVVDKNGVPSMGRQLRLKPETEGRRFSADR